MARVVALLQYRAEQRPLREQDAALLCLYVLEITRTSTGYTNNRTYQISALLYRPGLTESNTLTKSSFKSSLFDSKIEYSWLSFSSTNVYSKWAVTIFIYSRLIC